MLQVSNPEVIVSFNVPRCAVATLYGTKSLANCTVTDTYAVPYNFNGINYWLIEANCRTRY